MWWYWWSGGGGGDGASSGLGKVQAAQVYVPGAQAVEIDDGGETAEVWESRKTVEVD